MRGTVPPGDPKFTLGIVDPRVLPDHPFLNEIIKVAGVSGKEDIVGSTVFDLLPDNAAGSGHKTEPDLRIIPIERAGYCAFYAAQVCRCRDRQSSRLGSCRKRA